MSLHFHILFAFLAGLAAAAASPQPQEMDTCVARDVGGTCVVARRAAADSV